MSDKTSPLPVLWPGAYKAPPYPGGIKERSARQIMEGSHPERILESAVSRMISRGPLQREVMTKLHIYKGSEHKHQGQNPQIMDIAKMNRKNIKSN